MSRDKKLKKIKFFIRKKLEVTNGGFGCQCINRINFKRKLAMSDNKVRWEKKNCKKELIEKIEGVITNILVDVAAGNSPKLEVPKNLRNPNFNDRLVNIKNKELIVN